MGLREKVTITLVIIALIQIACRHCMPRTSRKASLKRYLNDLKPVKNNPVPTPNSPSRVNKTPKQKFGKRAQNGRINQNSLPNKSLYQRYNFPENEYPLDNSPRDPFRFEMNFNENNHVNTLQQARNLPGSQISDLKKEMKMKRKLLSNKQVNNENRQLKTDMSSIKFAPSPDSTRFLDSETFPEVQYPLNSMDTWGPNYWNYLPFTQEKPFQRFGQQTFNPKTKEDVIQPFTRLKKAKASKYLQSYDKLKEEHRRTSTENSKRSNVGQTGLNFTKTATCERVSDDFITAGLVSNIPSNSTEMKKALTSSTKITASSENTCPVTEYPYHPVPIPYKGIENNNENISPALELKYNTEEFADVDNSVNTQTLQLIQEILFNDDTSSAVSPGNFSKELEKNMNTSDCSAVPEDKDIPITLVDCGKNLTITPSKESSQEVSDDMPPVGILQNNLPSVPEKTIPENIPTVASPLNVGMPFPFSEPLHEIEALTNTPKSGLTNMAPLSNGFAVPSSTSIIIIPMNNNVAGKSKSHMFETTPDTQIFVYLPSTQTPSFNQTVSSSLDYTVPNNQVYNVLSNMAPLLNGNPFSPALVSELLNSNSDSGSSLPTDETLPTNSMCYNNESSPSSMREKPVLDILIDRSLTDVTPFVTKTRDEKMSEQPIETGDLDVNTNILPPITDFEHPLFDFSGSEFTLLSHGPYNNVLDNELPIIAREIDSYQQILNFTSKALIIPTQNVTSEHLHKTTSMDSVSEDSLSEIPNDVSPEELDKNFLSVTPTDSIDKLKTNTLLPDSIPNLQEPVDTLTESLPQPIDKILLSTTRIEPPSVKQPQPKESPLSPTLLSETFSDKLPEIMDAVLSTTPVSVTTTDSTSQNINNTPSTDINSSPMMTDKTIITELYKIRQILDKMLSAETPTNSQPPPLDNTLLPIYDSDRLLLSMNETPTEILPVPVADKTLLPLPATDSPIDSLRQVHETLLPISVDATPTDTISLPGNKLVNPYKLLETDTPSLPIDETIPLTLEFETSADKKPNLIKNLVTPLSETVTSRTKDTPDNGFSHKMEDFPIKMDLKIPNIYEVSSDDLLLSVDHLPTKIHPETTNPGVSTNDLPTQVVGTPISEVPVSDLAKTTDMFSLPVDEVLEDASPDVQTGSVKTLMSGFTDKLLQDFPSSKVPSDGLPTLPMNVFKLPIHETFPDSQFNEIVSTSLPQNSHLPSSVQKLIPNLCLSNALANELSLEDDSPSLIINRNIQIPHSTVNAQHLPLEVEHFLSPENYVTPDSVVTDIPSAVSPSLNKGLQTTNLDQTSNEVFSVSTLSEIPRDELTLPVHKMSPLSDGTPPDLPLPINKTPTTSKLPITKALLENVFSDINKGALSSLAKALPVKPESDAFLDKRLKYVVVKSPLSETKNIPLRHVAKIYPNSEHIDNLIDYVSSSVISVDTSIIDLVSELLLATDEMYKNTTYIPTDNDHDKKETQSFANPTHDLPVPIKMVSPPMDTTKTPSSSKLPITKALLENVLSDITTRGFSVPVAQSLPVTSNTVLGKTLYDVESPISNITDDIPVLPVDKTLPITSLSDHSTDNLPISIEDTLPLPIDKTFSELRCLDIPTELSSPIDNMRPDIQNISMCDKEQDASENPSSKNLTNDLPSASPMEEILSLSKDTLSDLKNPKNKTPSSSKLPITKALLENVLSDITTRGFSVPVAQSLPVTSNTVLDKTLYYVKSPITHVTEENPVLPVDKTLPITSLSDHSTENLPISIEYNLPSPIDKTFLESQSLDIPTELSSPIDNLGLDTSIYDKEQDESVNLSSKNLIDELSSVSPMEGIHFLSKDTLSNLKNTNYKIPSSSELPITKALLEKVLSDITTSSFSVPVAQSLPVTSPSVLDKTHHYVGSPISHITVDSPALPVDKTLPITSLSNHSTDNLPISIENTLPLPIDKTFSELRCLDIPTELSSPIDNLGLDISIYDKEQDESVNLSSKNLIDELSSVSPMEEIHYLSKDTLSNLKNTNYKIPSSSELPITKALLEKVLSDITTSGFSVPVAQSLPVTSPSVLDKTHHYVGSSISHITVDSPALPVDKTLPITSLSDHSTDNLPISIEDTLPLPIDKTFSELRCLDIPTELSSPIDNMRPDIQNILMCDKKQDASENPSSKNLTNYLPSASPMEEILSLSKDTLSDLKNPNNKTPSSSKLPITKALLENVLSDITTRNFSVPVAQSLPVTSPSVLDKTLYYLKSPISHVTEESPVLPVDKTLPITSLSDHSTENLPISYEYNLPSPIDTFFLESQSLDIPTELSSPIDNLGLDISMYDKEQDETVNLSSKNLIDELLSVSSMEGILYLSKDTLSNLKHPTNKIPSSSELPITKALLENVLSDMTTRGFSVPVAQSFPVTSNTVLDKTLYYVETPISPVTEENPVLPVDKTLPITSLSDHSTENLPISIEYNLPSPIDKTFLESQRLDVPTELSSTIDNLGLDISMFDKEQDESKNPSSKNHKDELSSVSPMEVIHYLSTDTLSDLKNPNNKISSSSELPITKALLEYVLSDITTRGFSVPVAQSLPVTSNTVLDKTLYHVKSAISHVTEESPVLPVDKTLPITSLFDHSTENLPISIKYNLPSPIDKTFLESQSLDIPTELSSPIDNSGLDTSMYDKEQDESENPSSKNRIDELSSVSPMEGIHYLSTDTLSDLKNPNNKTPSSSELPITKALLENVLSDITTKGFSVPVPQSLLVTSNTVLGKTLYDVESPISNITDDIPVLPVDKTLPTSLSDHSTDKLPISIEDNLPVPIDKTLSESQSLEISKELSSPIHNVGLDTLNISMYDIEQDESDNPSSKNLTNDVSSTSPLEGFPSLSKDTISDLKNPNKKIPSSSELSISKALLENVLSDITTRGFSVPVAQSLPVTSPSVLDKTHHYVESPISHVTVDSPALPVDKTLPITSLSDHSTENLPISIEYNLPSPIDKTFLESQSLDIPTELSSPIDNSGLDTSMYDKEQDESENPSSKNRIDELSSVSPMEGIHYLSTDTLSDLKNPNNKIPSSSELPITKALLENVLSDITTKGFSVPVPQSLLVTSPSVLDKTLYHVKFPISHVTEESPVLPVDKTLPITSLSDHSTENLPISIEYNLPSTIDKTFLKSQSLDIPTELSSPIHNLGLDISMYDKEQDESENPSSKIHIDELSSVSPMEEIHYLSKDTLSDLKNPNNKTPSSSKLPITKALLENVLSDITTRGFSVPVPQSLQVTSPSVLDKTLYHVKFPISHVTEESPVLPVDKTLPITSLSDRSTENLPISIEYNLPSPIDKTFLKSQSLDIPTELSSPIDNLGLDILMYDKEQDESENPSSKNHIDELSSVSPMEEIHYLSKDTLSDLKNPNNKTPSSSKLPITKALLENVLSDITTRGFSVPVPQSLLVTSPSVLDKTLYHVKFPISHVTEESPVLPVDKTLPITSLFDHSTANLPISIEYNLPSPIDKTFLESQSLDIPTELSSPIDNSGLDTSMYDKEQDESENPSSKNRIDELSSVSPMEGIHYLSTDTLSDLKNPNNKTPSSSKLPITKALLENVLSDITTRGFSVPVAQSLPVTSNTVLGKTLYDVESPISNITDDIPVLPVDKTLPITSLSDHSTDKLPISIEDNLTVPIDKTLSESQSLEIPKELSSPIHNVGLDTLNISMYDIEQDESDNPSSKNLTNDVSSTSPLEGFPSLSKDTISDLKNPNKKIPSSSELSITKALLENVLSDITTRGFSVPVAQSLPVTSPSVLDKTHHYVESPISHVTVDSPALPVDKTLPITSLSDHSTENLPISIEYNLPSPIDKTFLESRSLDIPTELSSPIDNLGLDISMYDKEQDESENPSSKIHIDELSSVSPMEKIHYLSKDTLSDLKNPNNKTPSSSKLPITKALLENVLSDITTRGFSVPVPQSLQVTSPSVLDKTLYHVKFPISHVTEESPVLPVDKTLPITSLFDHSTENLPISIEYNLPVPIDKTLSESQSLEIPKELSSPIHNVGLDTLNISMYDKEQDERDNPSSKNLTNDVSSTSPLEGFPSLSIDTISDLKNPNNKIPSSSELSITKALLENVLSDITTRGFSVPVAQSLPVTSPSVLDKTHHYIESPISHVTVDSPALPVDKTLPITSLSDHSTDNIPISIEDTLPLPIDNMRPDIQNISMCDIEQDESENPSSKNLTNDLPSASPMEEILFLSKDTLSDLKNPNNKTPSSSKLPITKALVENVLPDINKGGLSSVAKALPITPHAFLDKRLHYVNVKSPVSETKQNALRPVEKIFPHSEHTDNRTDYVPSSEKPLDTSITDLSSELLLPATDEMHKSKPYIPTDNVEDHDKNETQSFANATHDLAVPIETVSPPKDTTKALTSSKLPITKALLENVLSDITTRSFSVPVAQSLPVKKPSVLDKTYHYIESPISHITVDSPALPVDKTLPITSLSDHSIDNIPISMEDTLPLPIDNMRPDIQNISMCDIEQDESENPSSKNLTNDLPSASPMEEILFLSKDTLSDPKNPNNKTPSSSKLPITKAVLENVLSDITTRGFSVPVAQSLPVKSPSVLDKTYHYIESPISHITVDSPALPVDKTLPITSFSDHSTDNIPISIEDTLPLPIDETFSELQCLDIPTELSSPKDNMRPDIQNISMCGKEQDESENSSSKNLTNDLPSASPMEEILSLSKDTLSDLNNPNNKTPSSSKLPITKALLENVLSDINKGGLSSVAKALPITPHAFLDKRLHYVNVKSPVSETKQNPLWPVEKTFPNSEHTDNRTDYVPSSEKPLDTSITDLPSELLLPTDEMHKSKPYIPTDNVEDHDKNETQSFANATHDLAVPIETVSPPKDTTKAPTSSKLPITKALLKNVLSDITTRGFSVPVAQSLPVKKPSVLDKTYHYIESPISHITVDSPALPVDKTLPITSLSDHSTDNIPISIEDTLPLPIDETFSELQCLDIPTELSSPIDNMRPDIQNISMCGKEQDESENPSSKNLTNDLPSASPLEEILSLSKDTLSDLNNPNNKTPSSSKLPITKALLENVLSDITTRGFSVPVAQSLPVKKPSVLDKTYHYIESPISHITVDSPALPVDKTLPITSLSDHSTDNIPISIEDTLPFPIDETFSELQCLDIPTELSSPIDNMRPDIQNISMCGKEQDESENPSSKNLTNDLPSASPMEEILSLSKDTLSDLNNPNNKTPSSSKLPITKALLENVLSDINKGGLSSVAKALPITPHAFLDKRLHYVNVKSPVSETKQNSLRPVEKIFPHSEHTDNRTDYVPSSEKPLDTSITDLPSELLLPTDEMHKSNPYIPTNNVEDHDKNETQSFANATHDLAVPIETVSPPKDTTKAPTSSKLPITKALLENVLSDITTRSFSVPVAQSLPVKKPSVLDKTYHYIESPISHITVDSPALPVDKTLPITSLCDHSTDNIPISIEDTLPLPIDNMRPDIQNISMCDIEQDESENPSSKNLTNDLPSASPMEEILFLSKDTLSDPKNPNNKTPSSSKLPITKALLENVLSDITTRGFSVPVAQSLPVKSPSVLDKTYHYIESPISHITVDSPALPVDKTLPITSFSDHSTDNIPISIEDTLPLPIDETFSELQCLDIPTELSSPIDNMRPDIQNISMCGKEQDESENPSSKNLTNDLPSASPMEEILSLSKDTLSDLNNPNNKTPSSSKLPITKALLENVLSDINKGGLSSVAKALPITPHAFLDKRLHYVNVKSPVSETKQNALRPVEKIFPHSEHTDNRTDYVPSSEKPLDTLITDLPSELLLPTDEIHKSNPYIPTNNVEDHDKNETQSFANATHDLAVPIETVSPPKDITKAPTSSKLPITKALLENVLSDITTRGFSVPVAQSLPVKSPSVLDKTYHYIESPISHITVDIPALPVDKTLPITSFSDHSIDNIPISIEDTLPLPIDETFSELQCLDIPTELSSPIDNMRPDIQNISMCGKEQDESENPSSKNLTNDLPSASPMEEILSLSKDTLSDLNNPNNKTPSSSKLPITKALLENVLSDINKGGLSSVAKALPITPHAFLDKRLHYVNVKSPVSETKQNSLRPVEKIFPHSEHTDNRTDYVPSSEKPLDTSITDLPSELLLPTDEMHKSNPYIPTNNVEDHDKNETQSFANATHDLAVPIETVSPPKDTTKAPTSSKLPITKALLENVLSDITTRSFSVPVAQSLPVKKPSVLDKTYHYIESPISHITVDSPALPVDKTLPITSLCDHSTDNIPISIEDTLPLPIDNMRPDIQNISMCDIEQDESENPSSKNLTNDLPSASPMEKILFLSKDTLSDPKNPNNKTPSSSKLPITKALLENVLSDITTRGFSVPVAQSLPVKSPSVLDKTYHYIESPISHITVDSPALPVDKTLPITSFSDHSTDNIPISIEDTLPLPIDETFSELQCLDIPTELSSPKDNMRPDIQNISMCGKEQDESENPSSKNLTNDLPSASPMEEILSLSKDTLSDLNNPNNKTPSSSKLPITKALLENVLSDINKGGLSSVAKALPITPHAFLDKRLHYVNVKSPVSETKQNPLWPVEKIFPHSEHTDNPTDYVPSSEKPLDTLITDLPSELLLPTDEMHKSNPYIPTNNVEDHDKNETQSFANATHDLAVPIETVSSPKDITKAPTSSKLPITKALLENVLSDITTRGFSVPVAQSLPVKKPSVLDKTYHYIESPISHITVDSPALPVDKTLPITSLSDHSTDNIPISIEDTLPLPIDETFSELQCLDIPTELSSPIDNMRPDIQNISMCGKEQDESENPSSKNLTNDLPSASPMEENLSLSKDTLSDLNNPNNKTPSSSKLPITKALLENVLSDITTRGFSVPVAQSLPVKSPSVLEKTYHYIESPISHITVNSPALPVDKTLPITSFSDHSTDNIPISIEDTLPLPIDETFSELQCLDIPTELSSPKDNMRPDIQNISMCGKEQDESENPSSKNLTNDLPSASPMEEILSLSKDTLSDLNNPNNKTPSSSKLPITKALLENVLSDINKGGLSSVAKALPITPHAFLDKRLHYVNVKSPVSETKQNALRPVEKIFPHSEHTDNRTDYVPSSEKPLDTSITDLSSELLLPTDEMHKSKPYIPTDNVEDHDKNETQSFANATHDLAVPIETVSPPKDTTKAPTSSKLPITKALLENVLSDITTRGFSVPVAQSLPVKSPSVLDKTYHYIESPISHITVDSLALPVDKTLPITSLSDHSTDNIPISIEDTLPLPIDNMRPDIQNISMCDIEQDESENPSSKNLTNDLPSASPMEEILFLSKDTLSDLKNPNNKTPSSSKLPITKALLENVLSDITTRGFSVPVAQSLPVKSPSVLDKTYHYIESPISHITVDSPALPVDKTLPITSFSDHSTDNIPISIEDTLPLPIDETFSELQCLDIPTELSSPIDNMRPDIQNISMCGKEQDESENPSSKNLTNDLPTASPMEEILSLSKDTLSDLKNPNNKTPSSSKLPITKALLENVLSDINKGGLSSVAKALPITPHTFLDKRLHYVNVKSPVSETKQNPLWPVEKTFPNSEHTDNRTDYVPSSEKPLDTSITDLPSELLLLVSTDEMHKSKPYVPTDNVEDHDKNETQSLLFINATHDLAVPIETVSPPKDTTKTPSSSKLPITKALLENVLSDINTRGFSLPVAQALLVAPSSQKTLYFLETPVSDVTEKSSVISTDNFSSSRINEDVAPRPDKTLPDSPILGVPTDKLLMDKIHNSNILTDDVGQEDNSEMLTDDVEDRDNSDNLTDEVEDVDVCDNFNDDVKYEDEGKSNILTDDVEDKDKLDIWTYEVEDNDKSYNWTDDIEIEDSNEFLFSDDATDDVPSDLPLPQTKPYLASRIPITKALLEIVLSDITDAGIHP